MKYEDLYPWVRDPSNLTLSQVRVLTLMLQRSLRS